MVTQIYEECWNIVLCVNLEIVRVAIWQYMVTKKLPYDIFGLPYDMYMGDLCSQCSIFDIVASYEIINRFWKINKSRKKNRSRKITRSRQINSSNVECITML